MPAMRRWLSQKLFLSSILQMIGLVGEFWEDLRSPGFDFFPCSS